MIFNKTPLMATINGLLELKKKSALKIGFTITNNRPRKDKEIPYYTTPLRKIQHLLLAGIVIYDFRFIEEILKLLDSHVDYIFFDTEIKTPYSSFKGQPFILQKYIENDITQAKVLPYKGNDLTVDAISLFLERLHQFSLSWAYAKNIAILGAGNIGTKLALKLLERGANVKLYRRNQEKLIHIIQALDAIKVPYSSGKICAADSPIEAAKNADILIGLTHGTPLIDETLFPVINPSAIVIDAGKGTIHPHFMSLAAEKNMTLFRADISYALEGHLYNLIQNLEKDSTQGRKKMADFSVVSGGILAYKGEIVVDNFHAPQIMYGMADGQGNILHDQDKVAKSTMEEFRKKFLLKEEHKST